MKTVGELKKAGLAFVKGDCGDNFLVKNPVSFNSYGASFEDDLVKNFSWRKNTGVKPDFSGAIEVLIGNNANEEHFICESASEVPWDLNKISRVLEWRPSLNQPSVAELDAKQSAIHKAWVDLKGDIGFVKGVARDEFKLISLCIESKESFGELYFKGEYYFTSEYPSKKVFSVICTIQEFTDYCEKMASEEKRMDIIGQNGNDGLHYDIHGIISDELPDNGFVPRCVFVPITGLKTKVNDMKVSDKPIFTQAMADAGTLPPVGSKITLFKKTHSKRIDEFLNEELIVIGLSNSIDGEPVITWEHEHHGVCCGIYLTEFFKPIYTRTDREKAIDSALDKIGMHRLAVGMGAQEVLNKLYDAGLLKC